MRLWVGGLVVLLLAAAGRAEETRYVFPVDAGVVDVTKAPYGAMGDGKTDDTAAIQKALDSNPAANTIIYLPKGAYLISATLKWPHGLRAGQEEKRTILQGESQSGTVIRLKDGVTAGLKSPMAMLWTGECGAGENATQHFRNGVRSLTLDAGANPMAIGAQFTTSSQGTFREVTIKCNRGENGEAMGLIGLDMSYTDEIGPVLVKDVTIEGFEVGIKCGHSVNSVTFENIHLVRQTKIGLENDGQCVSINGLVGRDLPLAVMNHAGTSLMVLTDARLRVMISKEQPPFDTAIKNEGWMLVRDLNAAPYRTAIRSVQNVANAADKSPDETVVGPRVEEWVSNPVLGDAKGKTLELAIKPTPVVAWAGQEQWISPTAFGAVASQGLQKNDASAALQQALDAGKSTVYLPNGGWYLEKDVTVPVGVTRLIGCEARVWGPGRVVVGAGDGTTDTLVIERIDGAYNGLKVFHDSQRPLVLSSCTLTYTARAGAGELFLEDVCGPSWRFRDQNIWGRQVNAENEGTKIVNENGMLWILGLRTERAGTLVETIGGKSEILGGLCCSKAKKVSDAPMFLVKDGALSTTVGESCIGGTPFEMLVRVMSGGASTELKRGGSPERTGGSVLPLYVGK